MGITADPSITLAGTPAAESSPAVADLDVIVSLAKRRGFVFPSSEIYGGINAVWDYGPLGVELKNNVKRAWWRSCRNLAPEPVSTAASTAWPVRSRHAASAAATGWRCWRRTGRNTSSCNSPAVAWAPSCCRSTGGWRCRSCATSWATTPSTASTSSGWRHAVCHGAGVVPLYVVEIVEWPPGRAPPQAPAVVIVGRGGRTCRSPRSPPRRRCPTGV